MQIVSQIENAAVDALREAATDFRVDTIESYGGQLDDDTLEWVRSLPAIWVVFAGAEKPTPKNAERTKWLYSGTFTVFCAQRNLSGNKALRQGDAANPGVYALMELANAALVGNDLGLPIEAFAPGKVQTLVSTVVNRDAVMVYGLHFHTKWVVDAVKPELLPEGTLKTIGLEYFLKPGDEVADAADEVTTTVSTTP